MAPLLASAPPLPARAVLVAAAAALLCSPPAHATGHTWGCCGDKQNSFAVDSNTDIHFDIPADREGDVWEMRDEWAYNNCDFNGAKHFPASGGRATVAGMDGTVKPVRYFASKQGLLGNACKVDEWPLKIAVSVRPPAGAGSDVTTDTETGANEGLDSKTTAVVFTKQFNKPVKNKVCEGGTSFPPGGKKPPKKPGQCKKACLKDPSCAAYDFAKKGRAKTERCLLWKETAGPIVAGAKKMKKAQCVTRIKESAAS